MKVSHRPLSLVLAGSLLAMSGLAQAEEPAQVRFSVPAWPGVTVKTALASTLLESLGYAPRSAELGATITYEAMAQNELDAFLAAWLPGQQSMYEAAVERDAVVDLGNNVDGARLGFAVPAYVYEAGLTSAAQLDEPEYADQLESSIYSIEVGTGMSEILNGAVDNDIYGLGDWRLSETSTPGMLSAVDNAIDREEWILFGGWTPHWMNIEYDIRYLDDPENMWGPDEGASDVKTLVTPAFAESNPNAAKLLGQLAFSADDQSEMILGFSYEEREAGAVALEWLRANPAKVQAFLDGVTTRDGEPAWPVVQQALEIPDA